MFLTKTRKVQTRWLTGFSKTGTNYFLLYERERGHSCILDVFSLCVCWPRTPPPHSAVFTFNRPHPIYPDRKRERERDESFTHYSLFSQRHTHLVFSPCEAHRSVWNHCESKEQTQCPHRCTHKTQYKGVGRRKQTLTHICGFLPENTNTLVRIKLKLQISSLLNAYKLQDKSSWVKYFVW